MQAADRQAALKKRGFTVSKLAAELGLSHPAVSTVLTGSKRSARVEQRLVEAIGLPAKTIWPEWYGGVATTVEAHAAIDPQLVGEIRRAMFYFGIDRGCALPVAIPRLRHVIMIYNQARSRLSGNETIAESAKLITAEVERYALALIDPDDPGMFARNWWEALDAFVNPGADSPKAAANASIQGGVKVKRGTVFGNYNG